jgi:hypothetical protein
MDFTELNPDQRREAINTQQRYQSWRGAKARALAFRGSMVWAKAKGHEYLSRVAYDKRGRRRQTSLGRRSEATERIKAEFERGRDDAAERLKSLAQVMARQSAVNRALGLGRVPLIAARILRALDDSGLLGGGIRVIGTNAIYAYEAAAGVHIDSALTTTEDIDLLLDSRARLALVAANDLEAASLLRVFQRVDRSFQRTDQDFRASNKDGYLIDLVKPLRNPPWSEDPAKLGDDPNDLAAVEIEGLAWHESAPPFEATVIDDRGEPLRLVTSDPRVFAIHKYWLTTRADREPVKRRRDADQACTVASLVATFMPHLPVEARDLRMLPAKLIDEAKPMFVRREALDYSYRP